MSGQIFTKLKIILLLRIFYKHKFIFLIFLNLFPSEKLKMPFIWNDEQTKFVENSINFDKSQYVLVRKLFIQFKDHVKVRSVVVFTLILLLFVNIKTINCFSGYK